MSAWATCLAMVMAAAEPTALQLGDSVRTLEVAGAPREYLLHVPPQWNPKRPAAVVLLLHGATSNARRFQSHSGFNAKADEVGCLAVYPEGTGAIQGVHAWNAGRCCGGANQEPADDVAFIAAVLDDLAAAAKIDKKRVYATGISNGGMLCYRLAAELPDRIAAIAPVAGGPQIPEPRLKQAVSVLHIHGTADQFVPYAGGRGNLSFSTLEFAPVEEAAQDWAKLLKCPARTGVEELPDVKDDGTRVTRTSWGPGKGRSEFVLITVQGGGHAWPGREFLSPLLGKTTHDVQANDLIWEFFEKHAKR